MEAHANALTFTWKGAASERFVQQIEEKIIIPALGAALEDIEEHPEKYLKKFGNLLLDGMEEFLGIPEIEESWKKLTDPKSSWGDRIQAGSSLVTNIGTDLLMVIGVGEEVRAAELLAKAGEKFGPAILNLQRSLAYKTLVDTNGTNFFKKLSNGKTLLRGFNVGPRLAPAGASLEAAGEGRTLTEWYSQTKDTLYRFIESEMVQLNSFCDETIKQVNYGGINP
ncbi:hypothetical protein [Tumebacillus flagellatus]|uniref:Uncharacterized protein n=1 Tax=Tumebacillus flagellatus TaxID=1157490 RepID=A0A074LSL2_9BACL|nr:hypothetical protein [Tumebacillus flagellatus]KEO85106.1 hypothetical protein EL26_00660 [Tumebacillus flagellatus]